VISAIYSKITMKKTLVALKTCADSNSYAVAKFVDCLVHHFSGSKDKAFIPVQCKLEDNLLKLSPVGALSCPTKAANAELFLWDQNTKRFFSSVSTHNVILQVCRYCLKKVAD